MNKIVALVFIILSFNLISLGQNNLSVGVDLGPSFGFSSKSSGNGIPSTNFSIGFNFINEFEKNIFFKTGIYSSNITYGMNSGYFKDTYTSTTVIKGLSIPLNIGRKFTLGKRFYLGPYVGLAWLNNRKYYGNSFSSTFDYQNSHIKVTDNTYPTVENIVLYNVGLLSSYNLGNRIDLNFSAQYSFGLGSIRRTDVNYYCTDNPKYNNLTETYYSNGSNIQLLIGLNYSLSNNYSKTKRVNKYWESRYGYAKDSSIIHEKFDSLKAVDIYNINRKFIGFGWDFLNSDGGSIPVLSSSYNFQLNYYYFLLRKFAIGYNFYLYNDHYKDKSIPNYLISDLIITNGLNTRYYFFSRKNSLFLDGNFDIGYQWYKDSKDILLQPYSGNGLTNWFSTGVGYSKSFGKNNRISFETKLLYRHYTKLLNLQSLYSKDRVLLNISLNYNFKTK